MQMTKIDKNWQKLAKIGKNWQKSGSHYYASDKNWQKSGARLIFDGFWLKNRQKPAKIRRGCGKNWQNSGGNRAKAWQKKLLLFLDYWIIRPYYASGKNRQKSGGVVKTKTDLSFALSLICSLVCSLTSALLSALSSLLISSALSLSFSPLSPLLYFIC